MATSRFSLTQYQDRFEGLVRQTGHKSLAVWAIACAERVLPYFEAERPDDHRPRQALETLHAWVATSVFKMAVIRGASLAAHAAAREVGEENAARSAARAAGQAVATAHIPAHAMGAALYALQATHRAAGPTDAGAAVARELDWQLQQLRDVRAS
jgi:hypothetical protein